MRLMALLVPVTHTCEVEGTQRRFKYFSGSEVMGQVAATAGLLVWLRLLLLLVTAVAGAKDGQSVCQPNLQRRRAHRGDRSGAQSSSSGINGLANLPAVCSSLDVVTGGGRCL